MDEYLLNIYAPKMIFFYHKYHVVKALGRMMVVVIKNKPPMNMFNHSSSMAKKWPFMFWACCYELQMHVDFLKLFEEVDMVCSLPMSYCM
jgi:hypothetical protein